MSRKARSPIVLPKGVEVKVQGLKVLVKGPKGSLEQEIRKEIAVNVQDGQIVVTNDKKYGDAKNFLGLYWALISNMVMGVTQGFEKKLEMIGVGFRAAVQGKLLDLQIGLSHPTQKPIPDDIKATVEKNTLITISGADKQKVGQFAADIRSEKVPEPYKGKGIRYVGEYVPKKAGKAGKAAK